MTGFTQARQGDAWPAPSAGGKVVRRIVAGLAVMMLCLPLAPVSQAEAASGCWATKVERWWGTYGESRCWKSSKVKLHRVRVVCQDGSTVLGDWRKPGDYSSALCWGQSTKSITVDKKF